MKIRNQRIVLGKDRRKCRVLFTPDGKGEAEVYFKVAGDSIVEQERIQFAVGQGREFRTSVSVQLNKGQRYSLDITMKEPVETPIQILVAKRRAQ